MYVSVECRDADAPQRGVELSAVLPTKRRCGAPSLQKRVAKACRGVVVRGDRRQWLQAYIKKAVRNRLRRRIRRLARRKATQICAPTVERECEKEQTGGVNEGHKDAGQSVQPSSKRIEAPTAQIVANESTTPTHRRYPVRERRSRFHIVRVGVDEAENSDVSPTEENKWQFENVLPIVRVPGKGPERYHVENVSRETKTIWAHEAIELVGPTMYQWCRQRPAILLDDEAARRYGLYDDDDGELWSVDEVMYVPQDTVVPGEAGVCVLRGPAYYARNRDEPEWGWSSVRLNSIAGPGFAAALKSQGIWSGPLRCNISHTFEGITLLPQHDDVTAIDSLDRYCLQHPTVAVRVSTPGHRPHFEATARHRIEGASMLISNTAQFCLQASLLNAVERVAGERYVKSGMLATELPALLNFATASQWLRENAGAVSLARIKRKSIDTDEITWAAKQTKGIYLIRLRASNLDHVICIDAEKQQILDAVEPCPLKLSTEAIKSCGGGGANNLRVMELRRVLFLGTTMPVKRRKRKT